MTACFSSSGPPKPKKKKNEQQDFEFSKKINADDRSHKKPNPDGTRIFQSLLGNRYGTNVTCYTFCLCVCTHSTRSTPFGFTDSVTTDRQVKGFASNRFVPLTAPVVVWYCTLHRRRRALFSHQSLTKRVDVDANLLAAIETQTYFASIFYTN